MHALDQWMYRGGRPNRLASLLNRWWAIVFSAGLQRDRLAALQVHGRRTGQLVTFPVVIADYQGERYLVAMLGEKANWVANVRAAGGEAVLRHGRTDLVHLAEVDPRDRAPILRRYVAVAPGGRSHIPVPPKAPLADFERIADQYPVFRIEPRQAA